MSNYQMSYDQWLEMQDSSIPDEVYPCNMSQCGHKAVQGYEYCLKHKLEIERIEKQQDDTESDELQEIEQNK